MTVAITKRKQSRWLFRAILSILGFFAVAVGCYYFVDLPAPDDAHLTYGLRPIPNEENGLWVLAHEPDIEGEVNRLIQEKFPQRVVSLRLEEGIRKAFDDVEAALVVQQLEPLCVRIGEISGMPDWEPLGLPDCLYQNLGTGEGLSQVEYAITLVDEMAILYHQIGREDRAVICKFIGFRMIGRLATCRFVVGHPHPLRGGQVDRWAGAGWDADLPREELLAMANDAAEIARAMIAYVRNFAANYQLWKKMILEDDMDDWRAGSFQHYGAWSRKRFLPNDCLRDLKDSAELAIANSSLPIAQQRWERAFPQSYVPLESRRNEIGEDLREFYFYDLLEEIESFDMRSGYAGLAILCAVKAYGMDHGGELPESLDALVPDFLPEVPIDAVTGEPPIFDPHKRTAVFQDWPDPDRPPLLRTGVGLVGNFGFTIHFE